MIWMRSTSLMRQIIHLLRFDRPYNPLPFLLVTICHLLALSNTLMVFLNKAEHLETYVIAAKDFTLITSIFSVTVKRFLNAPESVRITNIIEEEHVIDCYQPDYNERKWRRVKKHYNKQKKNMQLSGSFVIGLCFFTFIGIICRFPVLYSLDPDLKKYRGKPTAFISYIPCDYSQYTEFYIYIFVLHCLIILFQVVEGYLVHIALLQCIQKLLTDFEVIYILLDELANEYADFDCVTDKQLPDSNAKLRKDLRLLVQCHQNLNWTLNYCVKVFGYGIFVYSSMIALDMCLNAYFILQAKNVKIIVNQVLSCITYSIIMLLCYYISQCISNQNEIFRMKLAKVPWIGKPRWFKQTLIIMKIRANADSEIKPLGLYVLNLSSYKSIMKGAFSFANIFYTTKFSQNNS